MPAPEAISRDIADPETRTRILARIPQQAPFRFVDTLTELTADVASGSYRFRNDEFFYAGHFPGEPVTPGVILIETMAQISLVPLAIYLAEQDAAKEAGMSSGAEEQRILPLFAEADQVEFQARVLPGQRVIVRGERIYYRRQKLKCRVEMTFEDGTPVACAMLAGVAVAVASV